MVTTLEIVLGVAVLVVALSFVGVALERVSETVLVRLTWLMAGLAAVTAVFLVVGLAVDRFSWRELAITLGGFIALTAAELGAVALARGLHRIGSVEAEGTRLLELLRVSLDAQAQTRLTELEQTLARERAETVHLLLEQERAIREERRTDVEHEAEAARTELTEAVTATQGRLEQRLSAWSADLERGQQQLKARLEDLIRRQADALQAHEARLAEHAAEVSALEEDQHAAMSRIRDELERAAGEASEAAKLEIETHAGERRRALHEVGERLRARERTMREQIEREETELRAQLTAAVGDVERRHLEQLQRALDRAVVRLSEDAERQFDRQLRDSREKTAERLARELELSMEHFMKAAENEVVGRIADAAQQSAGRFQRQIDDLVRSAEIQTGISNERIRGLSERLEQSLEAAHTRLNAFEAHIELELAAKVAEIERALRSAGQTVERAQSHN
jgi:hypothetical protein